MRFKKTITHGSKEYLITGKLKTFVTNKEIVNYDTIKAYYYDVLHIKIYRSPGWSELFKRKVYSNNLVVNLKEDNFFSKAAKKAFEDLISK